MKASGGSDAAKRRAGEDAAEHAADGMVVGLGTGSTAAHAIRAIGRAVDGGLDVRGVATSYQSRALAREVGIPLVALEDVGTGSGDSERIDLAIDGADQVAPDGVIKGGGAAHAREKVVAAAADEVRLVVDETKLAGQLDRPVPIEVLPDASGPVGGVLRTLDGEPTLRQATGKDGPVITDNGNLVFDADFGAIGDPSSLGAALSEIPGVVEHGLFVGLTDAVHVGTDSGVERRDRLR